MIQELLEKYWAGDTTIEEERRLKAYFENEEVAEDLRYAAPYFRALMAEKALQMQAAPLPRRKTLLREIPWQRVAATILLCLLSVAGWRAWQQQRTEKALASVRERLYHDTYDNPEEAAREIKAALALVSSKLNKGKRTANKGLHQMEKVEKYIPKARE